jgi:hypothetical protein
MVFGDTRYMAARKPKLEGSVTNYVRARLNVSERSLSWRRGQQTKAGGRLTHSRRRRTAPKPRFLDH